MFLDLLGVHIDDLSPYTATISARYPVGVEFAGVSEDFGEPIGELIEAMLGRAVRQGPPKHLDGVLSEKQRIDDTIQPDALRGVRGFRLRRQMPGLLSGQVKLPLQIGSNNVALANRHHGIDVPSSFMSAGKPTPARTISLA